jgi:hypothetical protein
MKTETSWIDELIKWENAHPEYQPFKEDNDSQRQLNTNPKPTLNDYFSHQSTTTNTHRLVY